jgi:hypothetical protein
MKTFHCFDLIFQRLSLNKYFYIQNKIHLNDVGPMKKVQS